MEREGRTAHNGRSEARESRDWVKERAGRAAMRRRFEICILGVNMMYGKCRGTSDADRAEGRS